MSTAQLGAASASSRIGLPVQRVAARTSSYSWASDFVSSEPGPRLADTVRLKTCGRAATAKGQTCGRHDPAANSPAVSGLWWLFSQAEPAAVHKGFTQNG